VLNERLYTILTAIDTGTGNVWSQGLATVEKAPSNPRQGIGHDLNERRNGKTSTRYLKLDPRPEPLLSLGVLASSL
jgi:hypothetical protein